MDLAPRIENLPPYLFAEISRKIAAKRAAGADIITFAIGDPDLPTPPHVIREGNNVYGGAVNIAARIAGASAPGEILASDVVRGLARTSAGVSFDDRGEHELKGVGEPQRLFAVKGGA